MAYKTIQIFEVIYHSKTQRAFLLNPLNVIVLNAYNKIAKNEMLNFWCKYVQQRLDAIIANVSISLQNYRLKARLKGG